MQSNWNKTITPYQIWSYLHCKYCSSTCYLHILLTEDDIFNWLNVTNNLRKQGPAWMVNAHMEVTTLQTCVATNFPLPIFETMCTDLNTTTIMWLSCDCHVIIMWLSCDYHVTIMWLSCDYHATIMWLSCDYHVTVVTVMRLPTLVWQCPDWSKDRVP